jgi:preprotein translocase subunit SecD
MKLSKNRLLRKVLLAVAAVGLFGTAMNAGPREEANAVSQESAQAPKRSADNDSSLANGVYAVLREGLTREEVRIEKVPHVVLVYDRKYSDADKSEPPKYVAIDTSDCVPLVLAGPPDTHKDDRGWTLLNVRLAREHVRTLEEFTRAHLDGRVAILIDGEIITMHKVRTVIQDGKARITRCNDDACKTLLLKLTK